eukprot:15353792-Ditylum_brightwellii.AAC.1
MDRLPYGVFPNLDMLDTIGCRSFGPTYTCHVVIKDRNGFWEECFLEAQIQDDIFEMDELFDALIYQWTGPLMQIMQPEKEQKIGNCGHIWSGGKCDPVEGSHNGV